MELGIVRDPREGTKRRIAEPADMAKSSPRKAGHSFEIAPVPAQFDDGAVLRRQLIGENNAGAGALEQRLGNEKSKAEAGRLVVIAVRLAAARGDIGLADPRQDVGRKAGAVIGDGAFDGGVVP